MSRTIAVGDIHGCARALAALIEAIRPTADDTIVPLGDYIDRGPDSKGVIDQLLALGQCCRLVPILGNHEEMLMAAGADGATSRFWLSCGGEATVQSYGRPPLRGELSPGELKRLIPPEHVEFLRTCHDFHETATHLFVHASYAPDLPMREQSADMLRWNSIRGAAEPHVSGKVAVVGHTPQKHGEILDLGFLKCIDTYCHGGGWLTALEVHTGTVWQADRHGTLRGSETLR
jgi:serine/threonine protein phosphatase 1